MTAVKPGLAAADLDARCTCRCPRSEHRLLKPGEYGGCRVHGKCQRFELDETAAVFRPAIDPGVLCGCGASRGQHYGDNGRMRGPRGCQDFHLRCTPLCKHALPVLRRAVHGEPVPPAVADRANQYRERGYAHLELKPASAFEEPLPVDELEVPDAAPVAAPAPAPEPAIVPAEVGPGGEQAAPQPLSLAEAVEAAFTPAPVVEPHTPGAGWARAKAELGDIVPDLTDEDERQVDELLAAAARQPLTVVRAPRRNRPRPAVPTAHGSRAVVGEDDAVEEVAVASTNAAAADPPATAEPWAPGREPAHWDPPPAVVRLAPPPVDYGPLLAAALYVSARWYCPRCHQWPLNPGACPGCRQTLQAVYHVTIPRELP